MGIGLTKFKGLKKFYQVPTIKIYRNTVGLTNNELEAAVRNGITRRNALKRVRVYKWEKQTATTKPIMERKGKDE
jgi:hypothetical protein